MRDPRSYQVKPRFMSDKRAENWGGGGGGQTDDNNMTIKHPIPNPKRNPTIYKGKSRIREGTKIGHYIQTNQIQPK